MGEEEKNVLWGKVSKTDPDAVKNVTISGRNVTVVDAYHRIKMATDQFGPYGAKWGLKNIDYAFMDIEKTKLAILKAVFFYPGGSFEITNSIMVAYVTKNGTGYLKIDDDYAKKIETDTITKALSKLGFCADVFMGKFEDNRYVNDLKKEFRRFPTASKATDNDKAEIKKELIKRASEYAMIDFMSDNRLIEMLFDELSIPKVKDKNDKKALSEQYSVIAKWLNSVESFEGQLEILLAKIDEVTGNDEHQ